MPHFALRCHIRHLTKTPINLMNNKEADGLLRKAKPGSEHLLVLDAMYTNRSYTLSRVAAPRISLSMHGAG